MAIDPLALLKDYTVNNKQVECDNGFLYFGNVKVSLTHPTAWKPSTT